MKLDKKTTQIGIIGVVTIALLIGAYFMYGPGARDRMIAVSVEERVENEALEFSFAFESGADALSFTQSAPEAFEGTTLLQAYVLMDSREQMKYQGGDDAGEIPPAISVLVFQRTEEDDAVATGSPKLSVAERIRKWTNDNSGFTNVSLAQADMEDVKIDGAPAVHFVSEGLYMQDTYVVKYGDKMYLFVGQYIDESDYIHEAFRSLIDSVLFL